MMTLDYFQDARFEGISVAVDWVQDLESSDSRIHKETVIEKALMAAKLGSTGAQCFLFNCYLAYNPFFTYNVKKVPETDGLTGRPNPWPKFWGLAEGLRTRSITGHAARDAIEEMSEQFNSDEWNGLARRVLIKDLRCGISEKTLNKVLGKTDWRIPVFSCQLAQDSNDQPSKMKGVKRLEPKLDGVRVLLMVIPGASEGLTTVCYSRNGKVFENFAHIEAEVSEFTLRLIRSSSLKKQLINGFVLDGEVVGRSFQELMRQARRKDNADASDSVFYVFDIIPLEDFRRGFWNAQMHKRAAILEEMRPVIEQMTSVDLLPHILVDLDTSAGHDQLHRYALDQVNAGYEGIMIKETTAPYECKRSSFWMKWKPTITVDLSIIGFDEGTGRNQGRLGAIICEGEDNGRDIRVNVGSGLSDTDRDEYWSLRDQLIGRVVEVQADAVTQNQDGSYSLRFPRFVRFRGFEAGEKF